MSWSQKARSPTDSSFMFIVNSTLAQGENRTPLELNEEAAMKNCSRAHSGQLEK
jgi:hypothetical protein